MNELEHVIHLLKNKNATLDDGINLRLYWQEGYTLSGITVVEGWKVITWKRGKVIELYYGDFFSDALEVFEKHTKENE